MEYVQVNNRVLEIEGIIQNDENVAGRMIIMFAGGSRS